MPLCFVNQKRSATFFTGFNQLAQANLANTESLSSMLDGQSAQHNSQSASQNARLIPTNFEKKTVCFSFDCCRSAQFENLHNL